MFQTTSVNNFYKKNKTRINKTKYLMVWKKKFSNIQSLCKNFKFLIERPFKLFIKKNKVLLNLNLKNLILTKDHKFILLITLVLSVTLFQ